MTVGELGCKPHFHDEALLFGDYGMNVRGRMTDDGLSTNEALDLWQQAIRKDPLETMVGFNRWKDTRREYFKPDSGSQSSEPPSN